MIRKLACLVVMGLMLAPVAALAQNAGKEKAGVTAAEKWLRLLDKGEYGASWEAAGPYFRNRLSEQKWALASQRFRGPLGKLISRKLWHDAYRTVLPGVPKGEYVVMQFHTSFANKKSAVETVTTEMDKDGKWKVIGYLIG